MRREPALVDGIARETAAEMVVDAALAHARERELDRPEIAPIVRALPRAPEKFEHGRLGEFRRTAHAAVHRIDHAGDLTGGAIEFRRPDHRAPCGPGALREARHQRAAVLLDAFRI